MTANNFRFDLSDRLIHFFRAVDPASQSSPPMPEHFGFHNIIEAETYPALFLLRCAIRSQRIWATWSYRGGVRTIYGSRPAACFTEMPLAAFLEAGKKREKAGQAMSPYGLSFRKAALFDQGANPVIYGLSNRVIHPPKGKGGGPRLFDKDILPLGEQYRYVTYNPAQPTPIDWTHEREWRWPFNGDISEAETQLNEFGIIADSIDIPSHDLSIPGLSGIGVIVRTEFESKQIANDILTLIDRSKVSRPHFQYVLVNDKLPPISKLYRPDEAQDAMEAAAIDLDDFFDLAASEVTAAEEGFSQMAREIEMSSGKPKSGELGGCWLWFLDNTHSFVRALCQCKRVSVSNDGRYLASLPEFSGLRSRQQREEMTSRLAKLVRRKYGIEADYFSVLCSDNPNDVPFNVGEDHLDNRFFFNYA